MVWSSCGRSSPALDYADYYAYFVSSGGGVDNYSNADWDSCGNIYSKKFLIFALRTSASFSAMCILWTRMVSSSATTVGVSSRIPTGKTTLRTSATAVRSMFSRMVMSTAATVGVLAIPTGYLYVKKKYLPLSDHQFRQQLCVSCGVGWSRL